MIKNPTHNPLNVQLWIHQSNLLWSRLQTISAIQVGAFTGWYVLGSENACLADGVLILAFLLSLIVGFIMWRDIHYLDKFDIIESPANQKFRPRGRHAALLVLILLGIVDLLMLLVPHPTKEASEQTKSAYREQVLEVPQPRVAFQEKKEAQQAATHDGG